MLTKVKVVKIYYRIIFPRINWYLSINELDEEEGDLMTEFELILLSLSSLLTLENSVSE